MVRRVVVVGGGISGLTAAYRLLTLVPGVQIELRESSDRIGGKISTTPFAGLPAVDEGPDAYLTRVPAAVALARELGLDDELVNPATGRAAVWHQRLHPIPEGLLLGVPTGVVPLLRSRLLSTRGAFRAGLETVLPRSSTDHDNIGRWVRARFGDEVHERLLDPLVGSIYAADTDRFSLATVPQLAALATSRSVLLGARSARRRATTSTTQPIFEAPRCGMEALVNALVLAIEAAGGSIMTSSPVEELEPTDRGVTVDGRTVDAVILACPSRAAGKLLASYCPPVAATLGDTESASVVMVTAAVDPRALRDVRGLSGYLVPKPVQRRVTAVSFGSNKWAHWQPADGSAVLRISLGRDGAPVHDLIEDCGDEQVADLALAEVGNHLGSRLTATDVRVSRWVDAFPQYRPGHLDRVADVERHLADVGPRVRVTGASYRGMGIPACIQQASETARAMAEFLNDVQD